MHIYYFDLTNLACSNLFPKYTKQHFYNPIYIYSNSSLQEYTVIFTIAFMLLEISDMRRNSLKKKSKYMYIMIGRKELYNNILLTMSSLLFRLLI